MKLRIAAGKAHRPRVRRLSPARRTFKKIRARLVDLDMGRWARPIARFFLDRRRWRCWVVSELNTGLAIAHGRTVDEALELARLKLYQHTLYDVALLRAAVRRALHRHGRANPWTRRHA